MAVMMSSELSNAISQRKLNTIMRYHEITEGGSYDPDYAKGTPPFSWMNDQPFIPPRTLYHLTLRKWLPMIQQQGLKPMKPKLMGGKGEDFAGVWLTILNSVDDIVDSHFLPQTYYTEGVILAVDTAALDPERFVIGIEMPLGVLSNHQKISRNDYLERTNEIIYLDMIPAPAISALSP